VEWVDIIKDVLAIITSILTISKMLKNDKKHTKPKRKKR